jgi:hypothetical protein
LQIRVDVTYGRHLTRDALLLEKFLAGGFNEALIFGLLGCSQGEPFYWRPHGTYQEMSSHQKC